MNMQQFKCERSFNLQVIVCAGPFESPGLKDLDQLSDGTPTARLSVGGNITFPLKFLHSGTSEVNLTNHLKYL